MRYPSHLLEAGHTVFSADRRCSPSEVGVCPRVFPSNESPAQAGLFRWWYALRTHNDRRTPKLRSLLAHVTAREARA